MRKIKFRAWRFGTRVLSRVQRLELDNGRIVGALLYDTADKEFRVPIDDFVLMQYTGLKDKNGKEIYEGDIVSQNFIGKIIGVIAYSTNTQFRIFYKQKVGIIKKRKEEFSQRILTKNCEVIGNIYEHPELLEKKCY